MIIKLVRHGQSESQTGEVDATHVGDHTVPLTPTGKRQQQLVGQRIVKECPSFFRRPLLIYQGPYQRHRESTPEILCAAEEASRPGGFPIIQVLEDPRLREVEWGYDKPADHGDHVDEMRERFGKFYYRIEGGESPADCFDRVSGFLDTLMRQVERKRAERVLIVSSGLTMRCFVMRFMHLKVEIYDQIKNPKNGDIVTITDEQGPRASLKIAGDGRDQYIAPQFTTIHLPLGGLRLPYDLYGTIGVQPKAYPWKCVECGKEEVWPYPEGDRTHAGEVNKAHKCSNCDEIVFSC
ncbi:MAG: histidine phosphatase family protein [Promethearchaeota archaeon]